MLFVNFVVKNATLSRRFSMKFLPLYICLAIFAAFMFFFRLGSNSFHDADEARYSIVSRNVLIENDWLTPRFNGEAYFAKPPLKYWLTALLFRTFGTSEWTARFWSAAAGFGAVLCAALLGKRVYGPAAGLWAGFALATTTQFLYEHCARSGEMDAMVLFFLVSSMLAFACSEDNPRFLTFSFALMGFSSLTKNFAGFFPFGIVWIYLILTGKWRNYTRARLIGSSLVFLAISLSWVLTMISMYGGSFIHSYIVQQSLERVVADDYQLGGDKGAKTILGGFIFLSRTMFNGFYPWSLILLPAFIWALFQIPKWRKQIQILPLVWFLAFAIGLLLFKNKWYWYLVPLYPAAALFIGAFLQMLWTRFDWKSALIAALIIAGGILLRQQSDYNPFDDAAITLKVSTLEWQTPTALILGTIAALIAVWVLLAKKSMKAAGALISAALICIAAHFAALPLRYSQHTSEIDRLSGVLASNISQPENTIYLCDWRSSILKWYLGEVPHSKLQLINCNERSIRPLLTAGPNTFVLLPDKYYRTLQEAHRPRLLGSVVIKNVTYQLVQSVKS